MKQQLKFEPWLDIKDTKALPKYDFGTNKQILFVGRSSIFEVLALCDVLQARAIPNIFHRSHAALKLKHPELPRI